MATLNKRKRVTKEGRGRGRREGGTEGGVERGREGERERGREGVRRAVCAAAAFSHTHQSVTQCGGWSLQQQQAHCWTEVEQFQGTVLGEGGVAMQPSGCVSSAPFSELRPLTYLMATGE